MTVLQPDPSKSERHLLAAIHYWMRHNGWWRSAYGWTDRDGTVAIDPRPESGEVVVFPDGMLGVTRYIGAGSVRAAVDLLVVYGYLPAFFSSVYALVEDKYRDEIQTLDARVNELEAMLAHVRDDEGRRAFAEAMEYLR